MSNHTPVLLKEAIDGLNVKHGGKYIDATLGEAGYALEILKRGGEVLGIDQDINQVKSSKLKVKSYKNAQLVVGNFAEIESIAKNNDFFPADGVVFDLGLSLKQLRLSKKGFSYQNVDEPLDMRLSNELKITAANLINSLSQEELYEIFARYSEEIHSWAIAQAIVRARRLKKIETVGDLVKVINRTIGRRDVKVYSRIFQALRIAINNELENLKAGLRGAVNILKKEGRIVVVTFHSLEDRIVKRFVKEDNLKFLHKKPIFGRKDLIFERSAKMRVIIK